MKRTAPPFVAACLAAILLPACGDDPPTGSIPVHRVPGNYATPQAAIDAARPGEVVLIDPGVYDAAETRAVDSEAHPFGLRAALFMKEGVYVAGAGDPGGVVLRDTTAADSTVGVVFISTTNETVVDNLLFEGFGTGAVMEGNAGVILACGFRGGGIGVRIDGAPDAVVYGSLIEEIVGPGILVDRAAPWIAANVVRACDVGLVVASPGNPLVEDTFFCRNRVGVEATGGAAPGFRRDIVVRNRDAGFRFTAGADPAVVESDIHDNPIGILAGEYDPALDHPIEATGNYWNTLNLDHIGDALIVDGADDPAAGAMVAYRPISPTPWNRTPFSITSVCSEPAPGAPTGVLPAARGLPGELRGREFRPLGARY